MRAITFDSVTERKMSKDSLFLGDVKSLLRVKGGYILSQDHRRESLRSCTSSWRRRDSTLGLKAPSESTSMNFIVSGCGVIKRDYRLYQRLQRYCAAVLMSKEDPSPGPILNMIPAIAKFHVIRGLSNPCDDPPT